MMRSLYSGVAGLKTHQTKMDVIGNNISNVNTVAFKSSSTTFQDLMYQTTQAASGATANKGGTNAKQIGLGVSNGATKISITSAGAAQSTGDAFDIRLTDSNSTNFFIVNNGAENMFTRAGAFYIDGNGNLAMTTTGYLVMGWQVSEENGTIQKDTVSALRVMQAKNMQSAPEWTQNATFSGVLDKNDTDVNSSTGYYKSLSFYDNLGYAYNAKFAFKVKDADKGLYTVSLDSVLDSNGKNILDDYLNPPTGEAKKLSDVFGIYNAEADKNGLKSNAAIREYPAMVIDATTNSKSFPTKKYLTVTRDGVEYAMDLSDITVVNYINPGNATDTTKMTGFTLTKIDKKTDPDTQKTYYAFDNNVKKNFDLTEIYDITKSELIDDAYIDFDTTENYLTTERTKVETDTNDKYYFSSDYSTLIRSTDGYSYDVKFDTRTGELESVNGDTEAKALFMMDKFPAQGMGQAFSNITIDFSNMLNYDNGGTSTVQLEAGDLDGTTGKGKKLGNMTGVSVDTSGKIWGSYDNGNTVLLGQIAVAQFANASGLEEVGNNCYRSTLNSGQFDGIGVDVTADGGSMNTGQLEMSNVDLSAEFTDMIVTQRGFQANSRIITVSDTLLEELINLKR
ncbi:MAG: flagellar hook-basal body complex protein [Pseudobutyrivibrio sp.]|nr:flagellar hook-basal body complex protein [Pseudobutyrivibrio sp.]